MTSVGPFCLVQPLCAKDPSGSHVVLVPSNTSSEVPRGTILLAASLSWRSSQFCPWPMQTNLCSINPPISAPGPSCMLDGIRMVNSFLLGKYSTLPLVSSRDTTPIQCVVIFTAARRSYNAWVPDTQVYLVVRGICRIPKGPASSVLESQYLGTVHTRRRGSS